jgi:hypothetical protein
LLPHEPALPADPGLPGEPTPQFTWQHWYPPATQAVAGFVNHRRSRAILAAVA